MNAPYEVYVAVRYLVARRKQAFVSLISVISTVGLSVGVMATIVALALMTGLQEEMRDRILGSSAHVYVWKLGDGGYQDYQREAGLMTALPGVSSATPSIIGKALASSRQGETFLTIRGIDPALEADVSEVATSMTHGSLTDLSTVTGPAPGIVIGEGVAKDLGAFVGDQVTLVTLNGALSPMGMIPRRRRFEVVGIFRLGLYEYDKTFGFVTLEVAKRLVGQDQVQMMELRTDDIYAAPEVATTIESALGRDYVTLDWTEMNESLFSALWLEKMAVSITIGLIVMVAALNIVASLILLVMEKSRDIAILKTIGASRAGITRIFMLQGLIIGCMGTAVGALGGYALATVADHYRFIRLDLEVYQISHVPFTIEPLNFVLVVAAAVLVSFLATLYPSRQASAVNPAEALRYQ
jgi:lipoprotein-releasing system permease protein